MGGVPDCWFDGVQNVVGGGTDDDLAMHPTNVLVQDVASGASWNARNLVASPDVRFAVAYAGTLVGGGWNMGGHLSAGIHVEEDRFDVH